eukprot:6192603-Pleurochrysis_carterae.AAC.1
MGAGDTHRRRLAGTEHCRRAGRQHTRHWGSVAEPGERRRPRPERDGMSSYAAPARLGPRRSTCCVSGGPGPAHGGAGPRRALGRGGAGPVAERGAVAADAGAALAATGERGCEGLRGDRCEPHAHGALVVCGLPRGHGAHSVSGPEDDGGRNVQQRDAGAIRRTYATVRLAPAPRRKLDH